MAVFGLAQVRSTVVQLASPASQDVLQAVLELREICLNSNGKRLVRDAGGVEALVMLLEAADEDCTTIAVEALACLAVDDGLSRDRMHQAGAPEKLVSLLKGSPGTEAAHRALLALRILSDREADRLAIMKCGGIPVLVQMLSSGPHTEAKEFAAAVLGNMAAGAQIIKDKIMEADAIGPLVQLLKVSPDEIAAELAAVVLRNLASGNGAARRAIVDAGGLWPLLSLLTGGAEQLVYPMLCQVTYAAKGADSKAAQTVVLPGQCCFDTIKGQLCIATASSPGIFGCVMPPRQASPRASNAERYLLMRKLTVTEPNADTLELCFDATGKEGAARLVQTGAKKPRAVKHLQLVSISPCSATELKGAVMRLLTKLHLELDFKEYISSNED